MTLSALPQPDASEEPLEPRRLGGVPGYEARGYRRDCETRRPEIYSTAMRTRPFDTEDRPRGLRLDEGFALDIAGTAEKGRRRVGPDGALVGVPAYFAVEEVGATGGDRLRISYWLLFGRGERHVRGMPSPIVHEGDWERLDVILERSGRDRYRPAAVRFDDGAAYGADWKGIEQAAPGDTHPVVYSERRTHALGATGDCSLSCTDWPTWRDLRNVREEPWYGYGGGWGAAESTEIASGPIGPTPYDLGPAPDGF